MAPVTDKRRVVLVDDETGLLQMFEEVLGDKYHVTSFSSPEAFLKYIDGHSKLPFEILITDLNMPGMTGVQMIQKAQQKGYFFPSILLSGYLDKKAVFEAVDLGVYRLLEKPVPPGVVIDAIEELLIEYDIRDVRGEIKEITVQLREYYTFLSTLISCHIPEADGNEFALQTNSRGQVVSRESFDQLLDRLENRLQRLLRSENVLEETRAKRFKNVA